MIRHKLELFLFEQSEAFFILESIATKVRCLMFDDGIQNKSGKVAVQGDRFAVRKVKTEMSNYTPIQLL